MTKIEVDIICNFRYFFFSKKIKHAVFQKIILNIENLDIRTIGFGANINKIRL